jgi:hypothetical protein
MRSITHQEMESDIEMNGFVEIPPKITHGLINNGDAVFRVIGNNAPGLLKSTYW